MSLTCFAFDVIVAVVVDIISPVAVAAAAIVAASLLSYLDKRKTRLLQQTCMCVHHTEHARVRVAVCVCVSCGRKITCKGTALRFTN